MKTMTREVLLLRLRNLDRALAGDVTGRERAWAEQLAEALGLAEQALRQHATDAESPTGLFAEVDMTRPSLVRQVGELCREHDTFLEQAHTLQEEARRAARAFAPVPESAAGALPVASPGGSIPDFGELRQRVATFRDALERHRDGETSLVVESVTTDLGAGD